MNVPEVADKILQMCKGLSKTSSDPEEIAQIVNDHFLYRLNISPDLLLFSWKNAAKKGGMYEVE